MDLSLYTSESQIDRKAASSDDEPATPSQSLKRKSTVGVSSAPSPKVAKLKPGRPSLTPKLPRGRPPKPAKPVAEALSEDNDDQDYSPVIKKKKSLVGSVKKVATPKSATTKSAKPKVAKKVIESPVSSRTTPRRTVAIVRSVIDAIQVEENRRSDDSDSEDDNVALMPKKKVAKKSKKPAVSKGKYKHIL